MDQMRSYTINKGMMESWIKLFETGIKPAREAVGMPVVATWVNADRNQFIWVRRFPDGPDSIGREGRDRPGPTSGPGASRGQAHPSPPSICRFSRYLAPS